MSWVEEQEFSRLHHILLDIHPGDLRQELEYSTAAINVPDVRGKTPLLWAAMRADNYAVKLLLEFGADPNVADGCGNIPILYCYKLSVECLKDLLVYGSIVTSYKNMDGATALHYAARYSDDIPILEVLLDAGEDPMARDLAHWTPCHYAASENKLGAFIFLIEHGADIEANTGLVFSLLFCAVWRNSHACLVYLLEAGVDVACKDMVGKTILHIAAEAADERTLRIFASFELFGLDPDATYNHCTANEWFYEYRFWNGMDPPSEALEDAFFDLLFKIRKDRERATGNEDDKVDEVDEGDKSADRDKVRVRIPGSWI